MELSNSEYRRRVFMTLSQSPAKASLRRMASNTKLVNIAHSVTGITTEVGETIKGLLPYLTGASQLKEEFKQNACEEMGDTLYYVFVLAKTLKVKTPSLTKKVKLSGMTLTEAILRMSVLSTDMLDMVKKNYYGLESKTIDVPEGPQKVRVAKKGGGFDIVEKVVPAHQEVVFDKEAQDTKNEQRAALIAGLLADFIELFWPVCFTLFDEPPYFLASGNIAKLAKRYPDGFFDKAAQEDRDEDSELDAMSEAAAAASA
jgi:NTP pyrophosphatase (non-canonical NTP hydrolase)